MQGFRTHSSLETLRLHLCVTNIAIRCVTLQNPTLAVCYSLNNDDKHQVQETESCVVVVVSLENSQICKLLSKRYTDCIIRVVEGS